MKHKCNIGFLLTAEHSCYNAAFGLANNLQQRGHTIIFFVNAGSEFADYVVKHGFKVVPIPNLQASTEDTLRGTGKFRLLKRLTEHGPSVFIKQGNFSKAIEESSIDLFFLDNVRGDVNLYSVALAKMQVPTILVSYTFSSRYQSDYPPAFSSTIPPVQGKLSPARRIFHRALWLWTISSKGRMYSYDWSDYLKLSFKKLLDQIRDLGFERELRQFGWGSTWSEWIRRPDLPEVIFGHRALDWPSVAANPKRYYFGTTDLWRGGFEFDWSGVDPDKPIVYCNISTTGGFGDGKALTSGRNKKSGPIANKRTRMAKRYLDVVLDSFSQRPDWQLIVACGPFYQTLKPESLPSNIHLHERLPQLAILEKADVAIAWGGAGTIRECINFGVPMLIFPAWTDQFGNAARVFARTIGLRGNIWTVTSKKLVGMAESILTDHRFKASINAMREECSVEKDIAGLVAFVKAHADLDI